MLLRMLLRMDILTKRAAGAGYGIPVPQIINLESIQYCFEAALLMNSPIIISSIADTLDLNDVAWFTK
jgi:fructose/tagatose bisphosphate aldolase